MPIPVSLGAEILAEADTGRPELVITSGDSIEVGSPEDLREQIEAAQLQLARLTALADQYEASTATTSPCSPWCDHLPGGDAHQSALVQLPAPSGLSPRFGELVSAHLYRDEETPATHVMVGSAGEVAALDPATAVQFANHMESMAVRVREMARQAGAGLSARCMF
ncbi:DUF6907 domain-containing protein [Streptomyces xiamenensis]|uniref:DUF6907 domain-containing protein n=1 Tax=Streptomyces xiamenensis TaxID=408015 RepID=UPI003685BC23